MKKSVVNNNHKNLAINDSVMFFNMNPNKKSKKPIPPKPKTFQDLLG